MTTSIYDIPVKLNDGSETRLNAFEGKALLVVNVASKCGLTKQYEALEALYRSRKDQGFEVLAFPSNDFAGQEPGTDAEIADFCATTFDVTFPIFSKIEVKGTSSHPLYKALTSAQPTATGEGPMRERLKGYGMETGSQSDVLWNFEKFLISSNGQIIGRFAPDVTPDDPRLMQAVDQALAQNTA